MAKRLAKNFRKIPAESISAHIIPHVGTEPCSNSSYVIQTNLTSASARERCIGLIDINQYGVNTPEVEFATPSSHVMRSKSRGASE